MNIYAKMVKGEPEFFKNPLITSEGHTYNPPPEALLSAGYKSYSEETFDELKSKTHDITFEYHETKTEIRKVWVYVPNMEKAKVVKLTEINAACDSILNSAVSTYPETEVLTFDQQTSEANVYLQTKKPEDVPLLSALALGRGITLDDLVQRVIAKHTAFSVLSGHIIGQRQALEDRLDECKTVEDVEAIVVDIKLPDTSQNDEEVTEG